MSVEIADDSRRKKISIVISIFNEAKNLGPLYEALREATDPLSDLDWDFLFVDDGSKDDGFGILCRLAAQDSRVRIVQLARNFGGHVADSTGLQFARGDAAIVMAGDLQDPPREIPRFLEQWRAGGQVVWGVRATRDDPPLDRLFSRIFAEVVRRLALPNYPPTGTGGFCLIDRLVIDAFNAFPERNRSVTGILLFVGFAQTTITFDRQRRKSGVSKWSFVRRLTAAADVIISFSTVPIRIGSFTGLAIAVMAFFYMIVQIFDRLVFGTAVQGWTQLIVVILMLGGLQLAMLGVIGEYIWRTLDDVRRRPLSLIKRVVGDFYGYQPPLSPLSPPIAHQVEPDGRG